MNLEQMAYPLQSCDGRVDRPRPPPSTAILPKATFVRPIAKRIRRLVSITNSDSWREMASGKRASNL